MDDSDFQAIDFVKQAFRQAAEAVEVGKNDLLIWGGEFDADQLPAFLTAWKDAPHFIWAMIEEVSRFHVEEAAAPAVILPEEPYVIERLRCFGPAGDLDVRRDADDCYWHFIGEADEHWAGLDLAQFGIVDFWQSADPSLKFREISRSYFQWRRDKSEQRVTTQWVPDGIPDARFNYLQQKQYLDNGHVAFVRCIDFSEEAGDE